MVVKTNTEMGKYKEILTGLCSRDKNVVEKTVKIGVIPNESQSLSFMTFFTLGKILTTVSLNFLICNIIMIVMPHW